MTNKRVLKLILSALFITLSMVLTRLFSIPSGPTFFRFTLGTIPIILSSFILGPVYGLFVGLGSDLIRAILFPIGPILIFPVISSTLLGLLPYFIVKLIRLMKPKISILIILLLFSVFFGLAMWFLWTGDGVQALVGSQYITFTTQNRIIITCVSIIIVVLLFVALSLIAVYMRKRDQKYVKLTYEIAVSIMITEILIDLIYTTVWKTYVWNIDFFVVLTMQLIIFVVMLPIKTLLINLVMYAFDKSGVQL
ncbi:MAG: folate family ECF transporter S component [Bacilli bacterium]|jgi:ECF transporter S component (folate family)